MQAENIDEIVADLDEVFRYEKDKRPQDRAHDYLDRRGLTRTARDTAIQAAATDMVMRAYNAGYAAANGGIGELENKAMELAGIASDVYRASTRIMAIA